MCRNWDRAISCWISNGGEAERKVKRAVDKDIPGKVSSASCQSGSVAALTPTTPRIQDCDFFVSAPVRDAS